jgi:hypothetical protein
MDSQETIQFSSVPGKDLAHNKITIGWYPGGILECNLVIVNLQRGLRDISNWLVS